MRALACILVCAFSISIGFPAEAASKAVKPPSAAEAATVNIYCRIKLGGRTILSSGSGVFISERGVILTNAHVGQNLLLASGKGKSAAACSVRTGSPAKDTYTASLLYISPTWVTGYIEAVNQKKNGKGTGDRDFALLYVTGAKKGKLPLTFPALRLATSSPKIGDAARVYGYGTEDKEFEDIRDDLPVLSAATSITDLRSFKMPTMDVMVLAPSKAGQPGVSGGPVLSKANEIMGIATTISGETSKKLRGLRAITTAHTDRIVREDTGLTLSTLISGDLVLRATTTAASIPSDIRTKLETALRRVK